MLARRYKVLQEAAAVPDNAVFTPYRGIKTLCSRLYREGLLKSDGISAMHGDLYVITKAGREALAQQTGARA